MLFVTLKTLFVIGNPLFVIRKVNASTDNESTDNEMEPDAALHRASTVETDETIGFAQPFELLQSLAIKILDIESLQPDESVIISVYNPSLISKRF